MFVNISQYSLRRSSYILAASLLLLFSLLLLLERSPSSPSFTPPQKENKTTISNHLSIPSLAIEAPLLDPIAANEESYQQALQDGVVHFPGTPYPGSLGNSYYFGHSSDFFWAPGDFKTIFATLPDIQIGSQIQIAHHSPLCFYRVIDTRIIESDDFSALKQPPAQSLLTLQTSYPVGTAKQRFIAVTELSHCDQDSGQNEDHE